MRAFAQSIVETVRQPLLLLDDELRVQVANSAFFNFFQIEQAAIRGQSISELDGGLWNISALLTRLEQVRSGFPFTDFEVRQDFPRLGRRVMLLNGRQVRRDDDGMLMILLAIEDVTEKVDAQDELRRLNWELEDRVRERTIELETANKELEAFCYSVSHDLRAPLRALDGFSDELLRSYARQLDEKGRHYLQRVRSGTQRMGELIDDLLKLSRVSRGEMRRDHVDLSAMAKVLATEFQEHEPTRKVSFSIQPNVIVHGDPGLLRVVLENLLSNAWKFTSKNHSATIAFGQLAHEGKPACFVRDNGAGFDMVHAAKLFGAFQRLHPQRDFPGNGIGLATIQRIIHRHGGKVWADGISGVGATFYFTLPMKESMHE